MATKKFELNLTPQNEEWVKLIPNPAQNMDIVFNKLIDTSINEGLLLEVISQSLTVSDLSKFKNSYSKVQTKRAEHMADLEITPAHIERKKVVHTQSIEVEEEEIIPEELPPPPKPKTKPAPEKKISHGFDESVF